MNRFTRDMLMNRRDGRNPYGSRGGYVTSRDPRRRDRAMNYDEYEEDGRRGVKGTGRYGIGGSRYYGDRAYEPITMEHRDYNHENEDYGYGVGYFDYDTEDYMYDYGAGRLTSKDIKKWEKHLENADGTMGKHFDVDQVRQVAQQLGIRFDEYSPELLTAIVNMKYSDYCKVLGGDLMIYVKLAKAFLDDDDFAGTPEEKAYLYYKCIVEKE